MAFRLDGKTAIVTGAARGIGAATTRRLAALGARVVAADVDRDVLEESCSAIEGEVEPAAGDLTQPDAPESLVRRAVERFGGLDIVVNNAGYTWDNVIQKTTDEQFQAMLDIHVVAPFRLLRAASGPMREAAKKEAAAGRRAMRKVVNISSVAATDGIAGQAGYASGKGAILGLTRTLAKEWGRYSINVNAVAFGLIETRLIAPLEREDNQVEVAGQTVKIGVHAAALEAAQKNCPLGRLGSVEEAAGAILFFCSPLSDYVSGELLIVSGGLRF